MKKLFLFLLISIPFLVKAQNCNCGDNFRFVIDKIKNNYPGYRDKVTPANQQRFTFFTDSLQKAANSADQTTCRDIQQQWLSFFKDKHISIAFTPGEATPKEIIGYFSGSEKSTWNETTFNTYLQAHKMSLDEIEGVWYSEIANYEIGIVKDNTQSADEYIGFIIKADSLNWVPGQIKLRIKKTGSNYQLIYFRMIDHAKSNALLVKSGDTFDLGYFGKWAKGRRSEAAKLNTKKPIDQSPSFKILDKETNLLVIPYFAIRYKKQVDSLLEKNKELLQKSKHLIIDIRNNPGGTTSVFENILPYIYTNPIYVEGGAVWATKDNIKGYDIEYPDLPEATKKELKEELQKLKAHEGELYMIYPGTTIKFDQVLKNPQHVSVLMNERSASSAEFFILRAEQSKKVTLFGKNSGGVIDYIEILKIQMPCSYFTLVYPACRSNLIDTRPLDNVGITPNVIIPDNVPDWVEYVRKYKTN